MRLGVLKFLDFKILGLGLNFSTKWSGALSRSFGLNLLVMLCCCETFLSVSQYFKTNLEFASLRADKIGVAISCEKCFYKKSNFAI